MSEQVTYDVGIIGAGPGGYVAAIRASQLGLTVALIEKDAPGGVCLNWGCIPSKSLIHQAEMFHEIGYLKSVGVGVDISKFDYSKVQAESRAAATKLTRGVSGLIKKNKIAYLTGTASIKSAKEITVDGKSVSVKNIIVATGSRPKVIPGFEFDEKQVLSSTGILSMTTLPKKLVILGAGAIGMEFAYVMNSFGVQVSVVEMLPSVLPLEDPDVSALVAKSFTAAGITVFTATKALSLTKSKSGVSLEIERDGKKETLAADALLVAVGRSPNTENLGLEKAGVKTDRGFIAIKDYGQTDAAGIYAIGDTVAGTPLLAHVASKEGEIAVEHIANKEGKGPKPHESRIDLSLVPSAVYCNPQVGSFGLTENKAKEKNIAFKKFLFPLVGVGKAVAINQSEGFVKILADPKTEEILGAHVVGVAATEIIHELLLARKGELLVSDIASMIHAHPTVFEGVMEAARGIEGWAIHI